ncbi:MAG: hypothetical protein ACXWCC_07450 [Caldimonas sp.]
MGLRGLIVGLGSALLCLLVQPALAQPGRAGQAALRIDGFDIEQVASLAPGTVLTFSVFATPGAAATVLIEGAPRLLEMREIQPGVYEGAYTLGAGDRVRPGAHVVATVWRDGLVTRAELEEPLLLDGARPLPAAAPRSAPPAAEEEAPAALPPPTAYARAGTAVPSVEIAPAPPLYRPAPAPLPSPVPLLVPAPLPGPPTVAPVLPGRSIRSPRSEAACADCARVESIRTVEAQSGPAAIGAVAGGIFGALFGEELGRAHARHVTRVLGALGGALVGHEIGRRAGQRASYEVTLRLPNGERRVRRYDELPPFRVGDTVHLDAVVAATAAGTS